jgi:hypothetical protein
MDVSIIWKRAIGSSSRSSALPGHRTETDAGRPYLFRDAEILIDDFFNEVERVLKAHGISSDVIRVEDRESSK